MIEKLKDELRAAEGYIEHMELDDIAWCCEYKILCKRKKLLKKAIRILEKLERISQE